MKVPYEKLEIRFWICPECDAENKTLMRKDYIVPVCEKCNKEFEWGETKTLYC